MKEEKEMKEKKINIRGGERESGKEVRDGRLLISQAFI